MPTLDEIHEARLARKEIIDHSDCEECEEQYLFAMKDKTHEFSIGLSTILACLILAEQDGLVPELPEDWVIRVLNSYY